MLLLSDRYAAATTSAQRVLFVAAGEAMIAVFHGTAFQASYLLGSLSGLVISLVMLRSRLFDRSIAYVRIASSVLDLGLYLPVVGLYVSVVSVLVLMVWDILIARRLFQLGRGAA
jgi:hypothetical protein